jgi:triphosphatase
VEVAVDDGEIRSGRRRRSICEIELKLKRGQPALLFNLAREIRTVLPLQLGVQSKSERGYGLAQSSELRAVKDTVGSR